MQNVDYLRLRVALTAVGTLALTLTSGRVRFSPHERGLVETFSRSH